MSNQKQMGIELEFIVCKEDDTGITQAELDQFLDEFVELVEKYNYYCAGGIKLIDIKDDNNFED